jgi:protocatechuate 3,4-dioxygenase beta subunit
MTVCSGPAAGILLILFTAGSSTPDARAATRDPRAADRDLGFAVADRQTPQPRDPTGRETKGTAAIRGRVLAADTGRPLRRARISLTAQGLGADSRRSTSTGLDGRYEIKDLPAARYRIAVTRSGYLPMDYGQRRPGEQGQPIELADGQTVEKIDFALPRMGVITGRVTDENGEPIEGVSVYAMRWMYYEGRRRLVPAMGDATTDDLGEYRILRVQPGTYSVMASTKEMWTVIQNGRETQYGYMPTYFPGVAKGTEARRVAVAIGQEVSGTDFSLIPGRAATVSGMAVDSAGRPFTRVSLGEEIRGLTFASFRAGYSGPVAGDGTWTIANVPPGEYMAAANRREGDPQGPPEVALLPIVVDGADIDNVMLTGSSGGTVSGKVIAEGGEIKMSAVRVSVAEPLRNQQSPTLIGTFRSTDATGRPNEEGAFSAPHVFGQARFRVTVPDGWMLKAITYGDRDVTNAVVQLKSGEEMSGVQVVLTNQVTSIGGVVTDDKNVPLRDATVLVFTEDADRWFESSRSVQAARPDQQGVWKVRALPPGEYLAIALDYIEDGAWNDPEYLESLRRLAQKVTLPEGGTPQISLTRIATEKR